MKEYMAGKYIGLRVNGHEVLANKHVYTTTGQICMPVDTFQRHVVVQTPDTLAHAEANRQRVQQGIGIPRPRGRPRR